MIERADSVWTKAETWWPRIQWLLSLLYPPLVAAAVAGGIVVATDDDPSFSPDVIDAQTALREGRFERAEQFLLFEAYVGDW